MSEKEPKDKKDIVVIGGTPLYIIIIDATIRGIISFVTFRFLSAIWNWFKKKKNNEGD